MIKPQISTVGPTLDLAAIAAQITDLTVLAVHEHIQMLGRTQAEVLFERIRADDAERRDEPRIEPC